MIKLLFVHNKSMWYRISFFNELSKEIDTEFIFTNEENVEGLDAKYKILKRYGKYPFSVALGLINLLIQKDYNVVVFPSPDSYGERIDHILCFILVKLMNKPYIIWSERWKCSEVKRSALKEMLLKIDDIITGFIFRHANANVTSGGLKQKEYFLSLGVRPGKIYMMPYLSDIPFKHYNLGDMRDIGTEMQKNLGIENKKIILCVARLVRRKGIEYLIKAFAKLKEEMNNISLVIIGGEDYYGIEKYYGNELRKLCLDFNVSCEVLFVGHQKSDNLPPYYLLCNILVFPSIAETFADTGCLPISDAMYFGKPVISTNVVGFAYDLIENGVNGFMVPQKDADALYNAMKAIISNPALEKRMGEESKQKMKKEFTSEHMIKAFKKAVYDACAGV